MAWACGLPGRGGRTPVREVESALVVGGQRQAALVPQEDAEEGTHFSSSTHGTFRTGSTGAGAFGVVAARWGLLMSCAVTVSGGL